MKTKIATILVATILLCSCSVFSQRPQHRLPNGYYLLYKCNMPHFDWKTDTNKISMKISPNKFSYYKNNVEFLSGVYDLVNYRHNFHVNSTQYGYFDFTQIEPNIWLQEGINHVDKHSHRIVCFYAFIEPLFD